MNTRGDAAAGSHRVAVLVSGGGTNLQALIDARVRGELPCARLVLVLSSRQDAPALKRAERAGIPSRTVERAGCAGADEFDREILRVLRDYRAEVLVLAGFLSVLGPRVLRAFGGHILNVHPSLLPAFGGRGCYGLRVHKAALARGVKLSGATVHLVNEEIDGGEILMQKAVQVMEGDTPETLQKRVMAEAEWLLLPRALQEHCAGMPSPYN